MAYAKEKIILFDGTSLGGFTNRDGSPIDWELKDGVMTVRHGDIISKETYGDAMLHVEFRCPYMPDQHGQGRGNSGVYVHGCYEVQVLDSFGKDEPDYSDCSAVYSIAAPLTNASLAPLEWQTYDIIFRAPRYDGENKVENARLTLLHNGYVVHNNLVLPNNTPGGVRNGEAPTGPLLLQDHGNPVSFRNIWLVRI